MFFILKIILAITIAATFLILSNDLPFFYSPDNTQRDTEFSKLSLPKVDETTKVDELVLEKKNESAKIKPKVIKNEPLRVIKEEIRIDSSILTTPGIISWTNFFRQTNGFLPVKENPVLSEVAQSKLSDILQRQYFEHISPSGEGAGDIAKKFGYRFVLVGENLAMGDFINDEDVVKAWMNSPGHRENILKISYTEIGVAAKKGFFNGREVWILVQTFGVPLSFCKSPEEDLLAKIESQKSQLKSNKEHLNLLYEVIEEKKYQTREEYEKVAAEYNSLVPAYNFLSQNTKLLTEQYNNEVLMFNQCVDSIE